MSWWWAFSVFMVAVKLMIPAAVFLLIYWLYKAAGDIG